MTIKVTAKPVCEIYHLREENPPRFLGTLFEWNTGERQMRWAVDPESFDGGCIGRVPVVAAQAAAGAAYLDRRLAPRAKWDAGQGLSLIHI